MRLAKAVNIAPDIHWVGATDWHRRVFDRFFSLPYGTSYNAYLVQGQEKTALIDTVMPGFEDLLLERIRQVVDPAAIDFLVMNHAEPDHGGAIPRVLAAAPKAKLVASKRGVELAAAFYDVPPERAMAVADGDSIQLGGKTLQFLDTPWLHWPETMSTYCPEERLLFSCDFLGAHLASGRIFAEEVGDIVMAEAKRYYASIMMPHATRVQRALEKLGGLEIGMIAPSHGPVHRQVSRLIEAYHKWAGGPLEPKAVIIYASMYGATEALKERVAAALSDQGVETVEHNLAVADLSHMVTDLVEARALLVGSPTFVGGPHPLVITAAEVIRTLRPPGKIAALFGSYGWGGAAARQLQARLEPAGYQIVETLEVKGPPRAADLEAATALGKAVAERVLAG
jgi:flavorubredoxin